VDGRGSVCGSKEMIAAFKPASPEHQRCIGAEGGSGPEKFEGKTVEHLLELVERVLLGRFGTNLI